MRLALHSLRLTYIGIFSLLLSNIVYGAAANTPSAEGVKSIIDVYLRVEYEADTAYNREQLIKFTPRRKAFLESKTEPGLGIYAFYINSGDPIFVVDAYEIVKVNVKGKHASATVLYNRVGRIINGMGTISTALLPDKKDNDLVTLNLIFDKNQWWVLDPPPPRISKKKLIGYYEYQVNSNLSRWDQELIDPQYDEEQKANIRASRDQAVGALRILKSLP